MFKITGITRIDSNTVKVSVRCDAKEWHNYKKRSQLGHLYGTCISNEVSKMGIRGYNPTVSDRDNAQGGLKWIDLYYADTQWVPAIDNVITHDFRNFTATHAERLESGIPCDVIKVDFINKKRAA